MPWSICFCSVLLHLSIFFWKNQNHSVHRFIDWVLVEGILFFCSLRKRLCRGLTMKVRWCPLVTGAWTAAFTSEQEGGKERFSSSPLYGVFWKSGWKMEQFQAKGILMASKQGAASHYAEEKALCGSKEKIIFICMLWVLWKNSCRWIWAKMDPGYWWSL